MISSQRKKCKWGAWGSLKGNQVASLAWRLPDLAVILCYKPHVAELQTELNCVFWSVEKLCFFIGFAWLKLLLALVCACKSV